MQVVEGYKYLGLLYFVVIWAVMLYVLVREPHDKSKTISRHVAASRETFVMFAIVRTTMLPLWVLFAFGWLIPALHLPIIASVLFAASIGADLISAWMPAVDGRRGKVHKWSAFAIGSMYVPISILLALSPMVSHVARTIIWTDILLMIAVWVVFALHKTPKEYYLYFQLSYFVFFDMAFLSAAFL